MSFWDAAGTFVRFGFQARWFQEPDDLFVELRISVRITYRYGPTSGKASRSCCTTQSALGCRVTLKWRIWRRAVLDHEEAVQQLERQRRHREEVKCHDGFAVILKKRQPPFSGSPRRGIRRRYRATLLSETTKPSFCNSPWILGAPQFGFSSASRRINSRISAVILGRPRRRERQRQ